MAISYGDSINQGNVQSLPSAIRICPDKNKKEERGSKNSKNVFTSFMDARPLMPESLGGEEREFRCDSALGFSFRLHFRLGSSHELARTGSDRACFSPARLGSSINFGSLLARENWLGPDQSKIS